MNSTISTTNRSVMPTTNTNANPFLACSGHGKGSTDIPRSIRSRMVSGLDTAAFYALSGIWDRNSVEGGQ
jgi:hypothetical protein